MTKAKFNNMRAIAEELNPKNLMAKMKGYASRKYNRRFSRTIKLSRA
jgi:hypothetical protein